MQSLFLTQFTLVKSNKTLFLVRIYFFSLMKKKLNTKLMFSPDSSPPVFQNCPYVKVGYAERSKTSGRAWWNEPLGKWKKYFSKHNNYLAIYVSFWSEAI
jgi:hypothetical protein